MCADAAKRTLRFTDADGKRQSIPTDVDRHTCEGWSLGIRRLVGLQKSGNPIDADGIKFLADLGKTDCGKDVLERLAKLNIIAPERAAMGKTIDRHIVDYGVYMAAPGDTPQHQAQTVNQIKYLAKNFGWRKLSDIKAADIDGWRLKRQRKGNVRGTAAGTLNGYLTALNSFCKWLCVVKRLSENPIGYLKKLNAETDPRHPRDRFSEDELMMLLRATIVSPRVFRGFTGYARYLLYRFATDTGFRWEQTMLLTVADFDFARANGLICCRFWRKSWHFRATANDELQQWATSGKRGLCSV